MATITFPMKVLQSGTFLSGNSVVRSSITMKEVNAAEQDAVFELRKDGQATANAVKAGDLVTMTITTP